MDRESHLADSILKDSQKQKEARKVMGAPPRFICEGEDPAKALLVNPHRIITHDGKSEVVSEDAISNAYEKSLFPATTCHVAKFLQEEWLHEASIKMKKP